MEKNYPLKQTTRKGGKNSTTKNANPKQEKNNLFIKNVPSNYCAKVDRQKLWDNMPQPKPKANQEAETSFILKSLQKPIQKLEADMPSEMMPTQKVGHTLVKKNKVP